VTRLNPGERTRVRVDVDAAARVVAPQWPLDSFIAVNPLEGLLQDGFEGAASQARRWLGARCYPDPAWLRAAHRAGRITDADLRASVLARHPHLDDDSVTALLAELLDLPDDPSAPPRAGTAGDGRLDRDLAAAIDGAVATWCAAFVGSGSVAWPMPGHGEGLYRAWRRLAPQDPMLSRVVDRGARRALRHLPEHPEDAIVETLAELGVAPAGHRDEMRRQLCRLPGWAGYARWSEQWAPPDDRTPRLRLVDLVAVRLVHERLAAYSAAGPSTAAPRDEPAQRPGHTPPDDRAVLWLDAYERHYRDELLTQLTRRAPTGRRRHPTAQLVCCIDARSEGLRRHVEAIGDYDTLGFAGFFGVAIRYRALSDPHPRAHFPVLVASQVTVEERPLPGHEQDVRRHLGRTSAARAARAAVDAAKTGAGGAFALAEASGWVTGPAAAARTFRPRRKLSTARRPDPRTAPTANATSDGFGFTVDEQVLYAETALVTMGLTDRFAPLVVLCGHRGHTTNNPHAAALDCGACGGNPGGPNARVAAAIFNRPDVRAGLQDSGVTIPASTWFLAAEHDTTTDTIAILDKHTVPPQHACSVAGLEADLATAGRRLATERVQSLPGGANRHAARHAAARAHDWAEVQPEWGLARNAAFIVGPRSMTAGLDLACRTFLHSYEARIDPDGIALETILTAPMVVAQWINAQYYFSTVDPDVFGAGDKTLHNPVGGRGVLVGGGGDLRAGLPRQSVFVGTQPYHEPMRLLTVVQAPLERITAVIDRNGILGHLFDGGWVTLAARADPTEAWRLRQPDGTWEPWHHAERPANHQEAQA